MISFQGPYRFLSNFHLCPSGIRDDYDIQYPSVEHAYQASKTTSRPFRLAIAMNPSPSAAKRFGRTIPIVTPDWEKNKVDIMKNFVRQKFSSDPNLKTLLIDTGNEELIEFNTWHDRFWGICTCPRCNHTGSNHMGRILSEVRTELVSTPS